MKQIKEILVYYDPEDGMSSLDILYYDFWCWLWEDGTFDSNTVHELKGFKKEAKDKIKRIYKRK